MNTKLLTFIYAGLVSLSYVQSIHLFAKFGDRNDPRVIRARITRIIIISIINVVLVPYVLIDVLRTAPDLGSVWGILGFKSLLERQTQLEMLKTLYLFALLFCGPLFELLINFDLSSEYESKVQAVRDLLVAPITEELFFTSIVTGSILSYVLASSGMMAEYSPKSFHGDSSIEIYLRLNPLFFGFAHLHHAIELYKKRTPLLQILAICLFQFTYTSLFGYLTNKIFINTGNFWCCFVSHSFCNFMGLPSLSIESKYMSTKIIYWLLLIVGVYQFSSKFDVLTYNADA